VRVVVVLAEVPAELLGDELAGPAVEDREDLDESLLARCSSL
jgi:hypothetical protein